MMGLLGKVLLAPLAPMYGVVALARELEREAWEELYGEEALRRELSNLEAALDSGQVSEAEYEEAELQLLRRIEEARRARAEQAR
jgi:hypothetical protein